VAKEETQQVDVKKNEKTQQVEKNKANVKKSKKPFKKSPWVIISQNPQKELKRLGVQLSEQSRETKAVLGGKGQETKEKGQKNNKGETKQNPPKPEGGLNMEKSDVQEIIKEQVGERLNKLEGIINRVAGHIGMLTKKEEEEERKKAEAEERAKLEKIISTRVEEKIKPLKNSIDESLKKANEETRKMIEELKKAQVPPEPKKEKIDFDSEEYQNRIVKNVIERAKPETRRKIAESLTVEERLCLEKGVCPVHIVKQLEEKGFVIKKKEDAEKKKEEKKKEEKKKSLI